MKRAFEYVLSWLYAAGLRLDRRMSKPRRLPRPVLSVGNISVGGRGKTPFVILLSNWLREHGWKAVVLTRGYGRKNEQAVFLQVPLAAHSVDAQKAGDEPLEIAALSGADVLVGADRAGNALRYLSENAPPDKTVFILDDGFQHWKLERDFDLVLLDPKDFSDRLLPLGRLRENLPALERASLRLVRGDDFEKVPEIRSRPLDPTKVGVLTTRAPDAAYRNPLLREFPDAYFLELHDHAPADAILARLAPLQLNDWLVGAKEAAKLVAPALLEPFLASGSAKIQIGKREIRLHYVGCRLEIRRRDFWPKLEDWLQAREKGLNAR